MSPLVRIVLPRNALAFSVMVCAAALRLVVPAAIAQASDDPSSRCAAAGTDDTPRHIPQQSVPAVNAVFGTRMTRAEAVASTVYRCIDGRVAVCTTGANLNCGKANASRAPGPGIVDWCRTNPEANFVPAFAAGHETIYDWACRAGVPRIERESLHADQQGFVAENWKVLPGSR